MQDYSRHDEPDPVVLVCRRGIDPTALVQRGRQLTYNRFRAQPPGTVVGSHNDQGELVAQAIRYPDYWKVVGYIGTRSNRDAWNTMGANDGCTLAQLYTDESLAHRPPSESAAIVDGHPERANLIRTQTTGLETGWYITTGYFWHDDPFILEGPIPEFETARRRRTEIEHKSAGPILYLDLVDEAPGAPRATQLQSAER